MESWAWLCNKTAQITGKTSTGLQNSVSDMLTRVHFPTFAIMADPPYGRLIGVRSIQQAVRSLTFFMM